MFSSNLKIAVPLFSFFFFGTGGGGETFKQKPGDIYSSARHKHDVFVGFPLRLMAHDVACTSLQDSPVSSPDKSPGTVRGGPVMGHLHV